MSLSPGATDPVVTYVSVAYVTATEVPNVSQTDITIYTTLTNTLDSTIGTSSTLSPSPTTTAILPTDDSTSSSTLLSTSSSSASSTTSYTTSSSAAVSTSSSSESSAVPASATLGGPTASSSPVPSALGTSGPSLSLVGIIGLSVALIMFFVAVVVLFCYYRRQRKFHREAMLIAPRLSQHHGSRSIETGDETLMGSSPSSGSFESHIKLGAMHPQLPARHVMHSLRSSTASLTHRSEMSEPIVAPPRSAEVLRPVIREQGSSVSNIYGIQYNAEGTLTINYEAAEQTLSADDPDPPGWDEALQRLNALRRELSPPPLRIVKRSASNPENQVQPPARSLRHPYHSDIESVSEADVSDSLRDGDGDRARATALAKLERRPTPSYNRYTRESVYSRGSDGTPFRRPGEGEARPRWRSLERL